MRAVPLSAFVMLAALAASPVSTPAFAQAAPAAAPAANDAVTAGSRVAMPERKLPPEEQADSDGLRALAKMTPALPMEKVLLKVDAPFAIAPVSAMAQDKAGNIYLFHRPEDRAIDPVVVFSSLDSFFGGFGRGVAQLPPTRLFPPTETRIINMILEVFFRSLKDAWSPIMDIDQEVVSSEINPQFAQIADENDLVILSRFEVEAGPTTQGFIDLVYPYASPKPVRDLLRSRVQTGDGNEESDTQWRKDLGVAVDSASVEMRVMLGEIPTSLGDIESMQPGDVLFFKKPDLARLLINDVPAFDVQVGNLGSQTAVQIQHSVIPGMQ